eukprot:1788983-Alexandrium_andersonii.AAC.1
MRGPRNCLNFPTCKAASSARFGAILLATTKHAGIRRHFPQATHRVTIAIESSCDLCDFASQGQGRAGQLAP